MRQLKGLRTMYVKNKAIEKEHRKKRRWVYLSYSAKTIKYQMN